MVSKRHFFLYLLILGFVSATYADREISADDYRDSLEGMWFGQLLGNRGLGNVVEAGRLGKAAGVHDVTECFEKSNIHDSLSDLTASGSTAALVIVIHVY